MDSTNDTKGADAERDDLARYVPWIIAGGVLAVSVTLGLLRGAPAVVLWLAFVALASAVLFFWETLRVVFDPNAPGDEAAIGDEEGLPVELEARNRAALRALRDLEFERAIHRLSEEDYKALEQKYRAEARAAMRAIDADLGDWLTRADAMLAKVEAPTAAKTETLPEAPKPTSDDAPAVSDTAKAACPKCETANDTDAVFCKKCGTKLAAGEVKEEADGA